MPISFCYSQQFESIWKSHDALKVLNQTRGKLGLGLVALSDLLLAGCDSHAHYLSVNKDVITIDEANSENDRYPSYSEAGKRSARNAIIFYNLVPRDAIVSCFGTFYKRIPLLLPALLRIGMGYDSSRPGLSVTVIDYKSGMIKNSKKEIIYYPYNGQQTVPMISTEQFENDLQVCGFPITITFTGEQRVTDVVLKLADKEQNDVPCFISDPEHPATPKDQMNTVCAMPKTPLLPKAVYFVSLSCTINDKPFNKEYYFSTLGKENAFDHKSPLSTFSMLWDDDIYKKCNTAASALYMSEKERMVIYILNLARSNPKLYAESVLDQSSPELHSSYYFTSLIKTLDESDTLGLLYPDSTCYVSALCHATSSGLTGYFGHDRQNNECEGTKHYRGECCDRGPNSALETVNRLLIDQDVPSLGHRKTCLDPRYTKLGVSFKPHKLYKSNAVLDFYD